MDSTDWPLLKSLGGTTAIVVVLTTFIVSMVRLWLVRKSQVESDRAVTFSGSFTLNDTLSTRVTELMIQVAAIEEQRIEERRRAETERSEILARMDALDRKNRSLDSDRSDLRRKVAALQEELDQEKAENVALRKEVASLRERLGIVERNGH